jgi:hypothetical protein
MKVGPKKFDTPPEIFGMCAPGSISSKLFSLKKVQFIGTPIVGPVLVSYYYRGKQEYMEEICCI